MYGIEKALRPVERQKGGVDDLEELFVAPDARGRVHSIDVDAATMPFALRGGKGADIGEQRGSRLRSVCPPRTSAGPAAARAAPAFSTIRRLMHLSAAGDALAILPSMSL